MSRKRSAKCRKAERRPREPTEYSYASDTDGRSDGPSRLRRSQESRPGIRPAPGGRYSQTRRQRRPAARRGVFPRPVPRGVRSFRHPKAGVLEQKRAFGSDRARQTPIAQDQAQQARIAGCREWNHLLAPLRALKVRRLSELRPVRFIQRPPRQARGNADIGRLVAHTEPVAGFAVYRNELIEDVACLRLLTGEADGGSRRAE